MKGYVASHLKEMNRQKVFQLIKSMEMTSKAEITKITGISSPTVIKIVNFLVDRGLVVEIGEVETAIGRRPHMIQVNRNLMYSVIFVLEGDFLSMGILDILGNVLHKKSIRVQHDYTYIMALIKNELVDNLIQESGMRLDQIFGIGIALPVIYNKDSNIILGAPLINRQEEISLEPDIKALSDKFNAIVMVENDTNAQAIGEFHSGRYGEKDDLLFVSAGTGLGVGLIIDGKLRRGNHYMCGEIGNTTFDVDYRSGDNKLGWLEDMVGHRRIEKKFGVNVINSNDNLSAELKTEICQYLAGNVALCINNLNVCLDCKNVIIGGKMVETLGQPLLDEINRYLCGLCDNLFVVKQEESEDVGLIGMAWLLTNKKIKEILIEEDI